MNSLNTMLKNLNNNDIILGIILIIYILGDYQTPPALAPYLTNITSYAIMITLFVIAIFNTNLIVAILLGISFVILINRSNLNHPVNIMPSQNYRDTVMSSLNENNRFNNLNEKILNLYLLNLLHLLVIMFLNYKYVINNILL
jgi:hypothetical protein